MPTTANAVLVVGATGTVGRRLVRRLVNRGSSVRAATRSPASYDGPARAEGVRFDYLEPETWTKALRGARRAFVLVPPDMAAYDQLVPFLDTAVDAELDHIVLMTAMGVDEAPDDMPLRRAERDLLEGPASTTILRPNWFMQNFTTVWRDMIEADGVMRLPAGDAATSFVDAEDIAAVAERALIEDGHAGAAYTLTGPEALTYNEAASILTDGWSREVRYEPIGDEEAHALLTGAGLDTNYAEMLIGLFQDVRAGHAEPVTTGVQTVTGRPPRSLDAFAEATADDML